MMFQRISLVFLLLLVACGREGGDQEAAAPQAGSTPRSGGRLVVALPSEPSSLDPLLFTDLAAGLTLGMMHRSLVRMDGSMQWQPSLAERWTWSDDGRILDLHLRPDLVWSDGQPFGPDDVVVSYGLYADPELGSPRASSTESLEDVVAVDDTTVRMTFAAAEPELLRHVALDPLPAHVVKDLDPADAETWPINRAPLVMGPFRLRSWTPTVRLVLERNPHYYGDPARLDEVEVKIVPDRSQQVLQLEAGEVDVVLDVAASDLERLEKNENVQLVSLIGRKVNYIVLNLENSMFEDVRVRQALSHAIDRRALVDGILHGRGWPGSSFFPPLWWCYDEDIEPDAFDPEQAALLLTEAGWVDTNGNGTRDRNGVELHFELTTEAGDTQREHAAVLMRNNLEDVGVSMEVVLLEGNTQRQRAMQGDFDAAVLQLTMPAFADPGPFVRSGGRGNLGHYENPELDRALDEALGTPDRDRAQPSWTRVQEILSRDKPVIVLYYPGQTVGLTSRVQGATPNLISPLYGIENWWVTP